MDSTNQLAFDTRDTKQLREEIKSQFNNMLLIGFIAAFTLGLLALGYLGYFPDADKGALFVAFLAWLVLLKMTYDKKKYWSDLKEDLAHGIKETVADKLKNRRTERHYSGYALTIGDAEYKADQQKYERFEIGQSVRIGYAPSSKYILSIDLSDD